MFKKFSDFAKLDMRSPDHPGTPVRSGKGFDVWQDKHGGFFVIGGNGSRIAVPSPDEAEDFARKSLASATPEPDKK